MNLFHHSPVYSQVLLNISGQIMDMVIEKLYQYFLFSWNEQVYQGVECETELC